MQLNPPTYRYFKQANLRRKKKEKHFEESKLNLLSKMEIWCQVKRHSNQSKLSNINAVNVEHAYIRSPLGLMPANFTFPLFNSLLLLLLSPRTSLTTCTIWLKYCPFIFHGQKLRLQQMPQASLDRLQGCTR